MNRQYVCIVTYIYPYEPNIIIYLYKFFLIVHGIKTTFSSEPQLSVYNVKYSGRPMRICEPVQLCILYSTVYKRPVMG